MKRRNRAKVYNLVPNNPHYDLEAIDPEELKQEKRANKNTLYDNANLRLSKILEIYRANHRTTYQGRRVANDEPGERDSPEIKRHNEFIAKQLRKKRDARERLKSQDKVPTRRDGRKVFEQFYVEATKMKYSSQLERVYNAAQILDYDEWLIFIENNLDGSD